MLYSEFIEGTGCKDNETNYRVYKDLEIMYMNSDMSKAEIYEYGKKLVDNSKSAAEIEAEAKLAEEIRIREDKIKELKKCNEHYDREIESYQSWLDKETEPDWIKWCKNNLKYAKEWKRQNNRTIANLKAEIRFMKQI